MKYFHCILKTKQTRQSDLNKTDQAVFINVNKHF